MASLSNSIKFSVHRSKFSSLDTISRRSLVNRLPFRSQLVFTRLKGFEFVPLPGEKFSPSNVGFSGKKLSFSGLSQQLEQRVSFEALNTKAAASVAESHEIEISNGFSKPTKNFTERYPALVTGFFFFTWYFLNVIFNILNTKVYNYFPYPYFVFVIHLLVGVGYCLVCWAVGLPKRANSWHSSLRWHSVTLLDM